MTNAPAHLALDARDIVGESLIWDDRQSCLWWVDIIGKRIHRFDPATSGHQTWSTPDFVTSIGLRQDDRFVVGLTKAIVLWDGADRFEHFASIEPDLPGNRLNEGVVGPDGAFWVGTMQNNIAPDGTPRDITAATGRIYRVDPKGSVTALSEDRFGITNTMIWTNDGEFITADTMENALYAYRIGPGGKLENRQVILMGFERGLPDGSTPDAEGHFWNCRVVGGACVARISPGGVVDRVVDLPCSWPTSCTFGGPDLGTLFVTSARFTMTADHLAANPQEGGIFAVNPGVRGVPEHRMA